MVWIILNYGSECNSSSAAETTPPNPEMVVRKYESSSPNWLRRSVKECILLESFKVNPIFSDNYFVMLRGLSQITFAFFGIFWPRTPLVCTFYVVNYTFFWPPTHPKCKCNLWKATLKEIIVLRK